MSYRPYTSTEPVTSMTRSNIKDEASPGLPASSTSTESTCPDSPADSKPRRKNKPNGSAQFSASPKTSFLFGLNRAILHDEIDTLYGSTCKEIAAQSINDMYANRHATQIDVFAANRMAIWMIRLNYSRVIEPVDHYQFPRLIATLMLKRAQERMESHLWDERDLFMPDEYIKRLDTFLHELSVLVTYEPLEFVAEARGGEHHKEPQAITDTANWPPFQQAWALTTRRLSVCVKKSQA